MYSVSYSRIRKPFSVPGRLVELEFEFLCESSVVNKCRSSSPQRHAVHSAAKAAINNVLAPEEPKVYRPGAKPTTRAPAGAQCFCGDYIPLRWSWKHLFKLVFYKHYVPPGRGTWLETFCQKTKLGQFVAQKNAIDLEIRPAPGRLDGT